MKKSNLQEQLVEDVRLQKSVNVCFRFATFRTMMKSIVFILIIMGMKPLTGQESKLPFVYDDGTTRIKVGGYVQASVAYDFEGAIENHDFIVSTLPVPENWKQQERLAIDATPSRVHLDVTHRTNSIGDIKFFMETDFRGASNVLRLRHAYISLLGFTAGQTWSFMYDNDGMAPTIDVQGVNSRSYFRTPLVGYTYRFGKNFSVGIAAEMPNAKITQTEQIISVRQTTPDIPAFVQYKASKGHLKLAGVFRNINYGCKEDENIKSKNGWGAQLTGSIKPVSFLTIYGQGIYGQGIGRYINDLAAQSLDLLPDASNPHNADALTMYGASVGLRADFSKKIYMTSNFSIAELDKNEKFIQNSDYQSGKYVSATLFWRAYPNLTLAAEYLYGYRKNMDCNYGDANRVQAMIRYNF